MKAILPIQFSADKLAITLSIVCALHCMAVPFLLVLLPSFAALNLDNEMFHFWMVCAVIPISLFSLTIGCKQHKYYRLMIIVLLGLTLLVIAVALGEHVLGEAWEKTLTMAGSAIIVYGHFRNFKMCQTQGNGRCHHST